MSNEVEIKKNYLINGPMNETKKNNLHRNIEKIISGNTNAIIFGDKLMKPYARVYIGITDDPATRISGHMRTYRKEMNKIRKNPHLILYHDSYLRRPDVFYLLYKDASRDIVGKYENHFLKYYSDYLDADPTKGNAGRRSSKNLPYYLYIFLQKFVI